MSGNYLFNPGAKMLHRKAHLTNKNVPYNRNVIDKDFPEQITELLNTEVILKYRNHEIVDILKDQIPNRPAEDVPYYERGVGPDDYDFPYVYEDRFRVIRADKSEPFTFVAMSLDYFTVLVSSTKKTENDKYIFEEYVLNYPEQNDMYIFLNVRDRHIIDDFYPAKPIRVDIGEPVYAIMVEFLDNNIIRILVGDECIVYIDEIIEEAESKGLFFNNRDLKLTKYEIAHYREEIFKGRTIYGSV